MPDQPEMPADLHAAGWRLIPWSGDDLFPTWAACRQMGEIVMAIPCGRWDSDWQNLARDITAAYQSLVSAGWHIHSVQPWRAQHPTLGDLTAPSAQALAARAEDLKYTRDGRRKIDV